MPPRRHSKPHRVTCLVSDGLNTFELGTVGEVFATKHPDLAVPWWYSLTLCAERPGPVGTAAGFDVTVSAGLDALSRADTIVVPSTIHEVDDDVSA
jgi:AraC family transcriptional regulator, transcriptional activator FtrA